MKDRVFLDTNIFVYTQSSVEMKKREVSMGLIDNYECYTSTQVFNEVSNVMLKKLKMSTEEVKQIIAAIHDNCKVGLINYDTVQKALDLKERYGYSYYDCLILASALESDCQKLLSEDMNDGQIIENKLEIVNPFKLSI